MNKNEEDWKELRRIIVQIDRDLKAMNEGNRTAGRRARRTIAFLRKRLLSFRKVCLEFDKELEETRMQKRTETAPEPLSASDFFDQKERHRKDKLENLD